ncbi:MAG: uracil-DNA glycosylase [Alphaproteobacteria bacterium]
MSHEPPADCAACPRLAAFRDRNRSAYPAYHNAPVASFGGLDSRLLVVGLAPGLKGANRTGRPFTGDGAGTLLYPALIEAGFAKGSFGARADDGLVLLDCRVTNAVRCVPPGNKPTPAEVATCRGWLASEFAAMANLAAVLALGAIAHGAVIRALGHAPSRHPFGHGAAHGLGRLTLIDSYHCSRLNTNTGRLTPAMFGAVLARVRAIVAAPRGAGD